jgi:predicted porin
MKKSLLALAALSAFAGAASAQSSVTLWGLLDVNVRGVDNGNGGRTSVSTDGNASSQLGFRGIEDLGGGLRAEFWIEAALAPDQGQAGSTAQFSNQLFNRRATLALRSGFGELRIGRDYTPTFRNHTVFDPFGTNGVGSQLNMMTQQGEGDPTGTNTGTLVRANNTVQYYLPAMGGLYGQFMWSPSEGTSGTALNTANEYLGGRIGFAAGPFNVAAAYGETKNAAGPNTDSVEAYNVGGSFNLGFMTLMGAYHNYSMGSAELQNILVGALFPLGPGTLKASYNMTEVDGGRPGRASGDAQMLAVGYVYDLSKRTALYTHYSMIENDSGLRFTASGSGKINGAGGFDSQGIELGVRHSF